MESLQVRVRVDFAGGASLGPGKITLLEAIDASGSLSGAARAIGMSYRRAWDLLRSINESFEHPAVALSVGGRDGGGAVLTEFGRTLIAAYRQFEASTQAEAAQQFAALTAPAKRVPAPAARRRPLARSPAPRRARGRES